MPAKSNLTYTWATTGTPPAAVSFFANGSNAAKNTTATFSKAGSYTFQVTITDAGGHSATSSVTVIVNQALTSITVTPTTATLEGDQTEQFTAACIDQFGNVFGVQPSFTWAIGSGVGSIIAGGLYTAPAGIGSATITATSGAVAGTVQITVNGGVGVTVIVDNSGPNVTIVGAWTASTCMPGYYGSNYLHRWKQRQGHEERAIHTHPAQRGRLPCFRPLAGRIESGQECSHRHHFG